MTKEPEMRILPITLPSLAIAVVTVPRKMTEADYDALVAAISSWKDAITGDS